MTSHAWYIPALNVGIGMLIALVTITAGMWIGVLSVAYFKKKGWM